VKNPVRTDLVQYAHGRDLEESVFYWIKGSGVRIKRRK
jgi:hypothetical protein